MTYTPPFTDIDKMPFGQHKDKTMAKVPAIYLLWLMDNGCNHKGVMGYINNNLAALQQEAKKARRK